MVYLRKIGIALVGHRIFPQSKHLIPNEAFQFVAAVS